MYRFYLLLFISISTAQIKKDSCKTHALDQVVVTGQFNPMSIKKSVFNVKVISEQDIKNLAATTLTDVLNQYININLQPNTVTGGTTVGLFGLEGQYFKILMDNIPVVSEKGIGNNTDVSQINLNDIERIEIVEGAMGTTHGANAVTGVLNIITKKNIATKWQINATLQEESVGKEYGFYDKGKHIYAVGAHYKTNWGLTSINSWNYTLFNGYYDTKKGKEYYENDGNRGLKWLPKTQISAKSAWNYQQKNIAIHYSFDYLKENISYYNVTVQSGYDDLLGSYRFSNDKRYINNRIIHNLTLNGILAQKIKYSNAFSFQNNERQTENYKYNLNTKNETQNQAFVDQAMQLFYATGTASHFFNTDKADMQVGYEIALNKGTSLISKENHVMEQVVKSINNYDFFVVSELKFTNHLSVRPGLRVSIQSLFDNQYASSLALRYLFNKGIELRASYGKAFRTPNFNELYTKQIFDGHFFIGNETLKPETSVSVELNGKKTSALHTHTVLTNQLSGSFLDIKDKIAMALVRLNDNTGGPEYQYLNISNYRVLNIGQTNQIKRKNVQLAAGVSVTGISQKLNNLQYTSDQAYLYTFNANATLSYNLPKHNTSIALYYKYNGKTQQLIEGNTKYLISTTNPTHGVDTSLQKSFFKNKLETTLGIRNLTNITTINQTAMELSKGHARSNDLTVAYGRSFFIKLKYHIAM